MQTDGVPGEMAISESSTYLTGNPGKCHSSICHGSCILIAVWTSESLATFIHRSKSTPEKERGRGGGVGGRRKGRGRGGGEGGGGGRGMRGKGGRGEGQKRGGERGEEERRVLEETGRKISIYKPNRILSGNCYFLGVGVNYH